MSMFEEIVNEAMLLTELSTNRDDDIKKAINNVLRVRITYDDKKDRVPSRAKGKRERYILPVAYGITKNGKRAIRAFQTAGSTKRGVPKWKLFLLDRILMWSNGNKSFKKYGDTLIRLGLNTAGDKHMTTLFAITPIGNKNVQVAKDSNPITSEPVAKSEVEPTQQNQNPATADSKKFEPSQSVQNTSLDNSSGKSYYDNRIKAPVTQPITKTDIQPQSGKPNATGNTNDNAMNPPQITSQPITKDTVNGQETNTETQKQDTANNPLTASFSDLMNRMDNLYNVNDEDENE